MLMATVLYLPLQKLQLSAVWQLKKVGLHYFEVYNAGPNSEI